jgi:hypothetical protein
MSGSSCAVKMKATVNYEGQYLESHDLSPENPVWETQFKKPGNYEITGEAFNADGVVSTNECKAKVEIINYPPECNLKTSPDSGYVGQPFKLDASGSSDKDGSVVKAVFTITDDKGYQVDKKEVGQPLVWDKVFNKSGRFTVSLKVTDNAGAVSEKTCESRVEVQKKFYLLLEAGPMIAKGTYTAFAFGRLGFAYLLVPERLSLLASAGGALKFGGDAFKNHFLSNLLLNLQLDGFFLGGGLGYSSKVREDWQSDVDIVGNIGFDIWKSFNKSASLFGEIRVPMKKGLTFEEAHAFLVGIRFIL